MKDLKCIIGKEVKKDNILYILGYRGLIFDGDNLLIDKKRAVKIFRASDKIQRTADMMGISVQELNQTRKKSRETLEV